jgi:long-chain acyl-CoA synthetase
MPSNVAELLTDTVTAHGDRTALKLDDVEVSYQQLGDASARIAGFLKGKGLEPGDRVGLMLPNVPHFAICYYGILRAGGVVVPMNPLLKGREVAYHLSDSGAKLLFAWEDFAEPGKEGAEESGAECVVVEATGFLELVGSNEPDTSATERGGDDTAIILYTSGTTGKPKGAELTHDNIVTNVTVTVEDLGEVSETDVLLGALPLFHAFGQTCGLNAAVMAGASLSLIPRFDPDKALDIIERDDVTIFEGVPTMYTAMLGSSKADEVDTSSLRTCMSGGSAMPGEVMRQFEEKFGVKVLEGYGLSETSPVASFNHPDKERKAGSIGTPIRGVEMKIVDDQGGDVEQGEPGEIVIRGHNIMRGYYNKPDETSESIDDDGWFYSGDVGHVDSDGYFFIVDRKKDMIIRGGYNIYPREIEEVLYEHPAIAEAAVIGVPSDEWGEEVGAAVVLQPDADVSAGEIREYVKGEVASYKYPRLVWFLDELPKGPTNKILKREIEAPEDADVAASSS